LIAFAFRCSPGKKAAHLESNPAAFDFAGTLLLAAPVRRSRRSRFQVRFAKHVPDAAERVFQSTATFAVVSESPRSRHLSSVESKLSSARREFFAQIIAFRQSLPESRQSP